MGFPAQLVSRDLNFRQQLRCGREQRSFLLVRGLAGAQVRGSSGLMTCDMGWTPVVMLATDVSKYEVSFTVMFDRGCHIFPIVTRYEHG